MLLPTYSYADVLRCKIEGYSEDILITTSPDTNSSDGQYARIGISRGIGNSADRMGATAFVELNADDTTDWPANGAEGYARGHAIDPFGEVFAPSQRAGACTRSR